MFGRIDIPRLRRQTAGNALVPVEACLLNDYVRTLLSRTPDCDVEYSLLICRSVKLSLFSLPLGIVTLVSTVANKATKGRNEYAR